MVNSVSASLCKLAWCLQRLLSGGSIGKRRRIDLYFLFIFRSRFSQGLVIRECSVLPVSLMTSSSFQSPHKIPQETASRNIETLQPFPKFCPFLPSYTYTHAHTQRQSQRKPPLFRSVRFTTFLPFTCKRRRNDLFSDIVHT